MSDRYPMRLGHYTDNTAEWDLDKAKLLPAVLKAGKGDLQWATHALGKWHVGWYYKNFTPTMRPTDHACNHPLRGGKFGFWYDVTYA
jgi:hypothetical protein